MVFFAIRYRQRITSMEAVLIFFLIGILAVAAIRFLCCEVSHDFYEPSNRNRELIDSVTDMERGTWSERDLVLELLKHDFPAGAIFHDLYLKRAGGKTTQIDLVLATKVGLIVFEVKDFSGWIFGRGNQRQWTQVLSYGQDKFRFYNPVLQNARHIAELRKQSRQFANIPIYSVIVFYGNCTLRDVSFIPDGTIITTARRVIDAVQHIVAESEPAQYTDKHEIVRILKQAVANGDDPEVRDRHTAQIQDMLGHDRVWE